MKKIINFIFLVCITGTISGQISTVGLTGYWPFNASLLANDSSGNGNNGTVHGATLTRDRFGNCNEAYKFNGVNNYIEVLNSSTVDMYNTDFTLACWIKTYGNDTTGLVINKNLHTGAWNGYVITTNDNDPSYCPFYKHAEFYVAAGVNQTVCSDSAICKDTSWHFLAGVYKYGVNKSYFYVDGVLQSTVGQSSGTVTNNTSLFFGGAGDINAQYFHGVIDAVRIYQRALSFTEIVQLYNEPDPGSNCKDEIEKYSNDPALTIYPNPGSDVFTIKTNSTTKQMMRIYDVNGRIVLSQLIDGITKIDATALSPGVYNLSVFTNERTQNQRLVIVR